VPSRESLSSLDIISVCGSTPIEIPILWPYAVMVGPRLRVLLTLPLCIMVMCHHFHAPTVAMLLCAHSVCTNMNSIDIHP
jgi:hypothetical protein